MLRKHLVALIQRSLANSMRLLALEFRSEKDATNAKLGVQK